MAIFSLARNLTKVFFCLFVCYMVRIYSSAQEGKSQSCCTSCLGTVASQLLSSDVLVQFAGDALQALYLGSAPGRCIL